MCRHLAAVAGPSFDGWTVADLLFDAPHSLRAQARFPRHQPPGQENPHGFGVAWYRDDRPVPESHRTVEPIWADHGFVADARAIECRTVIAAARLASSGSAITEAGNAPFVAGHWAFSLNGAVDGFQEGGDRGIGGRLRADLSPARRAALTGDTDSEVLFGLALDRIDAGEDPGLALVEVTRRVFSISTGRINLLLTDGDTVYATRRGNSLFTRGHVVASEPLDDAPGWRELADGELVVLDPAAGSRITAP